VLAIQYLKECVKKAPNEPTYQYHLGMAYMRLAQKDPAKASLERALTLNPAFPYALHAQHALKEIVELKQVSHSNQ
jgi:Flp pilus assembly protein TadD